MPDESRFPADGPWHRTVQRLRFSDNDSVGHVNNAIYATMFEAGRTELLNEARVLDRSGPLAAVIVRLEIDFRAEMAWPGDVLVETAIEGFGVKSARFASRLSKDGTLCAEGRAVLALIDRQTRRAIPLTEEIRARFAPWRLPPA